MREPKVISKPAKPVKAKPKPGLKAEIRRYTTLSSAMDILKHNRLTLLDPTTWDDKNDSYMVELYRQHVGAGAVTALCCSAAASETYHHWRIFTQGAEGVCVIFDRAKLEAALTAAGDLRFGAVEYKWIYELKQSDPAKLKDFAFIKRRGFKAEAEWRVIHNWRAAAGEAAPTTHTVSIPADCVVRIVINPWMPKPLFESVRSVLKQIQTRRVAAPVLPSRLTNSSQWQGAAAGLLKRYM